MFSEWHKIDLHIHTDKSNETKDNDYRGVFDLDVLINRLKDNSVEIISLTDHNIFNCDAYAKLFERNEIKALVGIELDIAVSEENLKTYICSQSNQQDTRIEIKPFHVIVIFSSNECSKLNELLNKMYGDISKKELDGEIDLNQQKKLRVTTFKYLIETFRTESFFIIAHGDKAKGIVPPYLKTNSLEEAQYNILLGEISALEMRSNIKMRNTIEAYNERFSDFLKEGFQEYPSSYVVFSDNHDSVNYKCPNLVTWFKGHLDYETLRIGFSDPESRIHTSDRSPIHSSYYIEKFNIIQKNNKETEIHFSPYLNVIIGGRSSGKSLLFNSIIKALSTVDDQDKQMFEENYKDLVKSELNKIKTNMGVYENNIGITSEVYCQEKIIELFKDDKDLKGRLENFFPDFDDEEIENEESKIKELFGQLKSCYKNFYEAQSNIKKGDCSKIIEQSVQTSEKVFEITPKSLNVEFNISYHDRINQKLSNAVTALRDIKSLDFKNTNLFTDDEQEEIKRIEKLINAKIENINQSKNKTKLMNFFIQKISEINNKYIKNELDQKNQLIEKAKETLNKNIEEFKEYFKAKLDLKKTCGEIEGLSVDKPDKTNEKNRYTFITKLNLKINKDIIIKRLFEEFFKDYDTTISIYQNLVKMADPDTDIRIKQKTGLAGKHPDLFDKKVNEFLEKHKSKKKLEIIERGSIPVSTASTSQGRKASIFLDIKLNSYFGCEEKQVLMIDQIEDNIDNKYISTNLVDLLRNLKWQTQIILVTHNPSIAVYGDAENIIICENKGGEIDFRQGGLENKQIRDDACQILDGGEIAFKNRMDKYNIEKLKKEFREAEDEANDYDSR